MQKTKQELLAELSKMENEKCRAIDQINDRDAADRNMRKIIFNAMIEQERCLEYGDRELSMGLFLDSNFYKMKDVPSWEEILVALGRLLEVRENDILRKQNIKYATEIAKLRGELKKNKEKRDF